MMYLCMSAYILIFLLTMYFWKGLSHSSTIVMSGENYEQTNNVLAGEAEGFGDDKSLHDLPLNIMPERPPLSTMAPRNVDLAIQQAGWRLPAKEDPGQPPLQHNKYVVVEEALPGRFAEVVTAHAIRVEGGLLFQDLQHYDTDLSDGELPAVGDSQFFGKISSRVRNGFNGLRPKDEDDHVADGKQRDKGSREVKALQGRVNKDDWMSPDGLVDNAPNQQWSPHLPPNTDSQPSFLDSKASSADVVVNVSVSMAVADFQKISDITIYSAFLDSRKSTQLVRMMAVAPVSRRPSTFDLWCLFSMAEAVEPTLVTIKQSPDCNGAKKNCHYTLSCQVPSEMQFSQTLLSQNDIAVVGGTKKSNSLMQTGEQVRLTVTVNTMSAVNSSVKEQGYKNPGEISFSVCVPPFHGKIPVLRLVEFVELNRILGAAHFTFYKFGVSREIAQVLTFYQNVGLATVLPWSLTAPSDIFEKGEAVAMSDCLYRSMHLFDFVVFLRVNEFIVPHVDYTWSHLLWNVHMRSENLNTIAATYQVLPLACYPADTGSCATSLEATPCARDPNRPITEITHFLTLRKNFCYGNDTKANETSVFVRPERVLELGAHRTARLVSELFVSFKVEPGLALVRKYRERSCKQTVSKTSVGHVCSSLVLDENLARYEKELIRRTKRVLQALSRLV